MNEISSFRCDKKNIACVTGASGTVGSSIARTLISKGFHVRLLQHNRNIRTDSGTVHNGSLLDKSSIISFLKGCQLVFHCAAEIRNSKNIWHVNVEGTKTLFEIARNLNIKYFCYISSVGVFGPGKIGWIDEKTKCTPSNLYEKSKYTAEKIVSKGIAGGRVVILRPTNIVSENYHGTLEIITKRCLRNKLKMFVIGGEISHIIHADNVAAAAIHCINIDSTPIDCYVVSCDHEKGMKFSDLEKIYLKSYKLRSGIGLKTTYNLPIIIPYLMRKAFRGNCNKGDVKYSSKKLIDSGFKFPLNTNETLSRIFAVGKVA